eukprot:7389430-Prymnesium_polylepis.1
MGELDGMWRRTATAIFNMAAGALVMANTEPTSDGTGDEAAWLLLSLSTLLQGTTTVNSLFAPFEKESIYLKSMESVMANEVKMFTWCTTPSCSHLSALTRHVCTNMRT